MTKAGLRICNYTSAVASLSWVLIFIFLLTCRSLLSLLTLTFSLYFIKISNTRNRCHWKEIPTTPCSQSKLYLPACLQLFLSLIFTFQSKVTEKYFSVLIISLPELWHPSPLTSESSLHLLLQLLLNISSFLIFRFFSHPNQSILKTCHVYTTAVLFSCITKLVE